MKELVNRILPSDHQYWGLSTRRILGAKARILLKFMIRSLHHPYKRARRMRKLRYQKGTRSHETVLVLGLGPSAGALSAEAIRSKQLDDALSVICVNNFFRSELAETITPDMYVLADPYFFGRDRQSDDKSWREIWIYLESHPNMTVFLPDNCNVPEDYRISNCIFFNSLGLEGFTKSINPTKPRGFLSMTVYYAIAIVGYLGYSRILLAGVDNTQFRSVALTSDSKPGMGANHFYDSKISPVVPMQHFAQDGMAAFFEDVARLFADLHLFGHLPVENLDPQTIVDAFPVASDWRAFASGGA